LLLNDSAEVGHHLAHYGTRGVIVSARNARSRDGADVETGSERVADGEQHGLEINACTDLRHGADRLMEAELLREESPVDQPRNSGPQRQRTGERERHDDRRERR